jgi:hypothetical protein
MSDEQKHGTTMNSPVGNEYTEYEHGKRVGAIEELERLLEAFGEVFDESPFACATIRTLNARLAELKEGK